MQTGNPIFKSQIKETSELQSAALNGEAKKNKYQEKKIQIDVKDAILIIHFMFEEGQRPNLSRIQYKR